MDVILRVYNKNFAVFVNFWGLHKNQNLKELIKIRAEYKIKRIRQIDLLFQKVVLKIRITCNNIQNTYICYFRYQCLFSHLRYFTNSEQNGYLVYLLLIS